MSTSVARVDSDPEALKTVATELLSAPVTSVEEVGGGRNSRVYRLRVTNTKFYALKAYFRHASDDRARMETEFASLDFLWRGGIRNIPKPVVSDKEHAFAIYEWIEGQQIRVQAVNAMSIRAATDFLCSVAELRKRSGSESLGQASEACFSGAEIIENLERRLRRLLAVDQSCDLKSFLASRFFPAFHRVVTWSRHRMALSFDQELALHHRTLSPSDFGFHNALQTDSGQIFFLDLEYFGWDDPAKTVSDFLLHPGMDISFSLKQQFASTLVQEMPWSEGLRERVQAYYPLFGLKWCLILLNEFLPDQLLRRRFAGINEHDGQAMQMTQLAKADKMLEKTVSEYEHFPYFH